MGDAVEINDEPRRGDTKLVAMCLLRRSAALSFMVAFTHGSRRGLQTFRRYAAGPRADFEPQFAEAKCAARRG